MDRLPAASGPGADAAPAAARPVAPATRSDGAPATTPAVPPAPLPGSARYFVLLYTPARHRAALATLLAIADELAVGLDHSLDHGVAHLRLQWWEEELARFHQGAPRHPWLIGWSRQHPASPDLRELAHAATMDLATQRLAARQELQLYAALFTCAAQLLGDAAQSPGAAPADPGSLGRWVGTLEAAAAAQSWAMLQVPELLRTLAQQQRRAPLLAPASQPPLAPLLLWLALDVHRWQRAQRRRSAPPAQLRDKSATMSPPAQPGRFDGVADNFIAWRYARRAVRRRFRIDIG